MTADFVTLSCPSCGAKLQVTHELERFACGFCGIELTVQRGGGIISLAHVVEGLEQVQQSVAGAESKISGVADNSELAAAEEAVRQIEIEIEELYQDIASEAPVRGKGWPTGSLVFGIIGIVVGLSRFTMGPAEVVEALIIPGIWTVLAYRWRANCVAMRRMSEERVAEYHSQVLRKMRELAVHQKAVTDLIH